MRMKFTNVAASHSIVVIPNSCWNTRYGNDEDTV